MSTFATIDEATLDLTVDRRQRKFLQRQVYAQLREMIVGGRMRRNMRLASTRALAEELGVSRTTIVLVYEQLLAEGLISSRAGSGYWVSHDRPAGGPGRHRAAGSSALERAEPEREYRPRPFEVGGADPQAFPTEKWALAQKRAWKGVNIAALNRSPPQGLVALRRALAHHLYGRRGLDVDPGQILITSGLPETIGLISEALLQQGDRIWMEDPGYGVARRAMEDRGLRIVAVPVDSHGIDVEAGLRLGPDAAGALITPTRQYPLGVSLSASRRNTLIAWARDNGGVIIEDDYDSEYRYRGQPLAPLFAHHPDGPVIHIGSFSKVLFAGIRLAYVVVPARQADIFARAIAERGAQASLVAQMGLAEFMESGDFARHVRRMRRLFRKRQSALVSAINERLGRNFHADQDDAGIHVIAQLTRTAGAPGDRSLAAKAQKAGYAVQPLSAFYTVHRPRQGLVLGFSTTPADRIPELIDGLAAALQSGLDGIQ
jgi:GntR family transcriptional regulator/MocR family aminotransferase